MAGRRGTGGAGAARRGELERFRPAPDRGRVAPVEPLTDRELTILGLLTSHLTFPEIGREFYISRHTVKTHVLRIYRKLGRIVAVGSDEIGKGARD